MNKISIKVRIKKRIIIWLGIDQLDSQIFRLQEKMDFVNIRINELKRPDYLFKEAKILSREIKQLVNSFQLGVDIDYHGDSWAVFCIGGKTEYVRFVRLQSSEIRELQNYIRKFPASSENMKIDLPMGMTRRFFFG